MTHGCPLVLLPISVDQHLNAAGCSALGVGLTVRSQRPDSGNDPSATTAVLTDPSIDRRPDTWLISSRSDQASIPRSTCSRHSPRPGHRPFEPEFHYPPALATLRHSTAPTRGTTLSERDVARDHCPVVDHGVGIRQTAAGPCVDREPAGPHRRGHRASRAPPPPPLVTRSVACLCPSGALLARRAETVTVSDAPAPA